MTADKARNRCPAAWFRPGCYWLGELQRNIDPLVEAGYRVILLDCPGGAKAIRSLIVVHDRILMHESEKRGGSTGYRQNPPAGQLDGGHSSVAFTLNWPERVGKLV